MVNKLRGGYGMDGATGEMKQREMDGMYRMLINDGIIDEEEEEPDRKVTREEAVKFLLRAVGYRKFAELTDVFGCTFADKKDINPKLIGYAVLAKSMHVIDVKNGRFLPRKELTRADAVILLYNYLNR